MDEVDKRIIEEFLNDHPEVDINSMTAEELFEKAMNYAIESRR